MLEEIPTDKFQEVADDATCLVCTQKAFDVLKGESEKLGMYDRHPDRLFGFPVFVSDDPRHLCLVLSRRGERPMLIATNALDAASNSSERQS